MNRICLILFVTLGVCGPLQNQSTEHFLPVGDTVEILTDVWGIPHIYASNTYDLFFAQGYYAARNRLFQFEIWRRQATGTVAEILGPRELKRDIGARLFSFRGDMDVEMQHYHNEGKLIIEAYVDGVNAYIDEALQDPEALPLEFHLLGIRPHKWTPSVVVSRHQGLLGNIDDELDIARALAEADAAEVNQWQWFHPGEPILKIDPKIDKEHLKHDILELYHAFRRSLRFIPEDVIAAERNDLESYRHLVMEDTREEDEWQQYSKDDIGSNNWAIDGRWTESGYPIMANDPHRRQSSPSLRYMAHLVAPGWNVIGGGEPEIPGISIGHNEHGAWGLTVFNTDAEDLYVYQLNPENPDEYWYRGAWQAMRIISDTIPIKNQQPEIVELRYSLHGPVVFRDTEAHIAYAVRCGWLEAGGSPYLASLRMDQASNFAEFREACHYSHIPGENMIWADRAGNIGWQAVGIAPIRRNWSGLVPVPGDGSYEWEGYLPIMAKPWTINPEDGIINTSNENVTPVDYPLKDAIGFSWSDPYRGDRVTEVLTGGRRHSLMDMAALQTDYLSIPARQIIPLLRTLVFEDSLTRLALDAVLSWDCVMDKSSVAAGIYNAFEKSLRADIENAFVPESVRPYVSIQMKRVLEWLVLPDGRFGTDPVKGRNGFLQKSFQNAVEDLSNRFGSGLEDWVYGREGYKHVLIRHPLSNAVSPAIREKLDVGPAPRGGNSFTVNNTSSNDNQLSGGSFRIIVDTGNWDHCLGTNAPGQHGDPDHPHYKNLFDIWASDQFFPVLFTKDKIEGVTFERNLLIPD